MSIISSGLFNKNDFISIIKFSNYNVYYNSNREYEPKYYTLITLLHEFCTESLDYGNNGIWKLKITSIDIDTFNKHFIGAWGNRSNNYSDFVLIDYILNAIKYIQDNRQISLTCNESIKYLSDFVEFVFNNSNPWPTLIYFSKFVSTFLPDLAIPFDTASLSKIAREYKINGDTKDLIDYINIHSNLKKDLLGFLKTYSMTIADLKELDDNSLIGKKQLFKLNQTPLNRPIDKIYYSV
jgi:hypothetical protein